MGSLKKTSQIHSHKQVKVKVWDNFTRLYHFSQLILFGLLWYSAEEADFELHFTCAFILMAFWSTRLFWGFLGSDTSKFISFVKMPWTIIQIWKANQLTSSTVGHNPIGACMVLALLTSLGVQLFTGLFASDDVFSEGPLYAYFSESTVEFMDSIHHSNFDILLILIGLHAIAGILHWFRGDNVIGAILSGKKNVNPNLPAPTLKSAIVPLSMVLIIAFSLLYWALPFASY